MNIIKNTSLYDTKKLKSLFCHVHGQLAKYEGRLPHWSKLKIQVMNKAQGRHASGCAYVGQVYYDTDMFLSLNKETSLERIAQVFAHELMHSYGYKHHQFRTAPLDQCHLDEINKKFVKDELLSPKAFHIAKKGISYKQKCSELMTHHGWLDIQQLDNCIFGCFMLELWDSRCDFDAEESYHLRDDQLRASSWCQAYHIAQELIQGEIQKEYTENWTTNLSEEFKEYENE